MDWITIPPLTLTVHNNEFHSTAHSTKIFLPAALPYTSCTLYKSYAEHKRLESVILC